MSQPADAHTPHAGSATGSLFSRALPWPDDASSAATADATWPISEIALVLGISRNTVKAALASDGPPKCQRAPAGSVIDDVGEPN